jgi:hypothetical protein
MAICLQWGDAVVVGVVDGSRQLLAEWRVEGGEELGMLKIM